MEAAKATVQRKSVFYRGCAGTGKSFLTKKILKYLGSKYASHEFVHLTHMGLLAVTTGAETFNGFTGIGVPTTHEEIVERISSHSNRWLPIKVVVIDEIQSRSAELLDIVFRAVSSYRSLDELQFIFVGDFGQLKAILRRAIEAEIRTARQQGLHLFFGRGHAFQSQFWRDVKFENFHLKTVHRQNEERFVNALLDLRVGKKTVLLSSVMQECTRPLQPILSQSSFSATTLFPKVGAVLRMNELELEKLDGPLFTFRSIDGMTKDGQDQEPGIEELKLYKEFPVDDKLSLKAFAPVMLMARDEKNRMLVNGSQGIIVRWQKVYAATLQRIGCSQNALNYLEVSQCTHLPVVQFISGGERLIFPVRFQLDRVGVGTIWRWMIPLKLAWAISIHKSQGPSLT